jgi:hypothetical protein
MNLRQYRCFGRLIPVVYNLIDGEMTMLRKTFLALATVAAIGLLAPGTASARGGFHGGGFHGGGFHGGGWHGGGWHGGWRGGGWGWGLGALGVGAAIGYGLYGPYGYGYYGYPYYGDYYDEGYGGGSTCYIVRRRVHTVHGWRIRRVEMCD